MIRRHSHWLNYLACIGLVQAVVMVLVGHFQADELLSPWYSTISSYAAADRSGVVEVGIFMVGLSFLALLLGMRASRTPPGAAASAALWLWGLGMIVTALVPTVSHGASMDLMGYVHRWSASIGFVALIVAGLLLARQFKKNAQWTRLHRPIRSLVYVSAASGLAVTFVTYAGDRFMIGLFERILGVAMLAMLILIASRLVQLHRRAPQVPAAAKATGYPWQYASIPSRPEMATAGHR